MLPFGKPLSLFFPKGGPTTRAMDGSTLRPWLRRAEIMSSRKGAPRAGPPRANVEGLPSFVDLASITPLAEPEAVRFPRLLARVPNELLGVAFRPRSQKKPDPSLRPWRWPRFRPVG